MGNKELLDYPKKVKVICPRCFRMQETSIHFYVGQAFPTRNHICEFCDYNISEDDWIES